MHHAAEHPPSAKALRAGFRAPPPSRPWAVAKHRSDSPQGRPTGPVWQIGGIEIDRRIHVGPANPWMVAPADDGLEQEANRVAGRVVAADRGGLAGGRPRQSAGFPVDDAFATRLGVRHGSGAGLPASNRLFLEQRMGADLGGVRLHQDAEANAMTRAIGAMAFTAGSDIYLATGRPPDPRVLAHELAHVLQQQSLPADRGVIQRMVACPDRLEDQQPTPPGWQSYHGDSSWFHCGFRGILEDRVPTPDDPQNECFYDHQGTLVDRSHPYAGCRGTPNQYDSANAPGRHTFIDEGGIVRAGLPAFTTSRVHTVVTAIVAAIEVVQKTQTIIRSVSEGLGEWIALGVLSAVASVEPGNWVLQGLPARSVRHLNVIGAVLSSASLVPNLDVLLRNLTRRLDSFAISELVGELAADISSVDATTAGGNPPVTAASLSELNAITLIELLRARGLLRFVRPPDEIARERYAAGRAASPAQTP